MLKRANIAGLLKAYDNLVKQSSYQYRYNNDPAAEFGYHMGTQAGDPDLALWNFMQDARRAGLPYPEAVRLLNVGMSNYYGYSPTGNVTGDDFGVDVRVPTNNGDSYLQVDPSEDVRQYQKKLYYRWLTQQSKKNMPTFVRNAFPGFMAPMALKAYMALAKKDNKELAQQYYDKLLAGKPMTRYQNMGPTKEYAQTARTYNGGMMGMTVDPIKTRLNIKTVRQEGPQGRIRTMPSGHLTLNYGGKHGGAKYDVNPDGTVNLRV